MRRGSGLDEKVDVAQRVAIAPSDTRESTRGQFAGRWGRRVAAAACVPARSSQGDNRTSEGQGQPVNLRNEPDDNVL